MHDGASHSHHTHSLIRTLTPLLSTQIIVEDGTEQGLQRIILTTNMPGKLLLHWGVEGGEGYKEGWRLPGERSWPDGTVMYKDRALQTPFKYAVAGYQICVVSDFVL